MKRRPGKRIERLYVEVESGRAARVDRFGGRTAVLETKLEGDGLFRGLRAGRVRREDPGPEPRPRARAGGREAANGGGGRAVRARGPSHPRRLGALPRGRGLRLGPRAGRDLGYPVPGPERLGGGSEADRVALGRPPADRLGGGRSGRRGLGGLRRRRGSGLAPRASDRANRRCPPPPPADPDTLDDLGQNTPRSGRAPHLAYPLTNVGPPPT